MQQKIWTGIRWIGMSVCCLLMTSCLSGTTTADRNCVPFKIGEVPNWEDLDRDPSSEEVTNDNPESVRKLLNAIITEQCAEHIITREKEFNDADGKPYKRYDVLALSGGGAYGAFGAGVLNGWSCTGHRPTFNVVTGISTGALLATYAFIGPEYDSNLERLFTTISDKDISEKRGFFSLLWADSVTDNEPLRQLIERELSAEVLEKVAAAHKQGRRLYIGTTNLDSRRFVVWDMGEIALRGDRELYREVVLASTAVPLVFPPSKFKIVVDGQEFEELHVDGGISRNIFLFPYMLKLTEAKTNGMDGKPKQSLGLVSPRNTTIWAISNGKAFSDPSCIDDRLLKITFTSISGLLYSSTRLDMIRLFLIAKLTRSEFLWIAVPPNFVTAPGSLSFDPVEMRKLFDVGKLEGMKAPKEPTAYVEKNYMSWRKGPPETGPGEIVSPRSGINFRVKSPTSMENNQLIPKEPEPKQEELEHLHEPKKP